VGLPMVSIVSPDDATASKWLDRHEEYDEVRSIHSRFIARMYAWLHEPDVWVMGGVTAVMAGLLFEMPGAPMFIVCGAVVAYWLWVCNRTSRVVRMYRKLSGELRILHVSRPMLELYVQELHKIKGGNVPDDRVRFEVLGTILCEYGPLVRRVDQDCGCQAPCYHEGRLLVGDRRGLRRKLRKLIGAQLQKAVLAGNNPLQSA
jgi:hypothetical protein